MTTVTYRDGAIASDSAITCYNMHIGAVQKVWKFETGALYGSCGDGDDRTLRKLLSKVKAEEYLPTAHTLEEMGGDIEALFVFPNGDVWHIQTGKAAEATKVDAPYHAIGKGRKFALGCMFEGGNARKAAECGAHFDINSGGSIQQEFLTLIEKDDILYKPTSEGPVRLSFVPAV